MRLTMLAVLLAGLLGIALWVERAGWEPPLVTVRVENAATTGVTRLRLVRDGKAKDYGPLAPGATRTLRYFATDKTTYRLEARMAGGATHTAGAGGVPPGWTIAETITAQGIRSEFRASAPRLPRPRRGGDGG
jgi:hypothetical protein